MIFNEFLRPPLKSKSLIDIELKILEPRNTMRHNGNPNWQAPSTYFCKDCVPARISTSGRIDTAVINAADQTRPKKSESQQAPKTLTSRTITPTVRGAEAQSSTANEVLLVLLTDKPKVCLNHATNETCVERDGPEVLHLDGKTRLSRFLLQSNCKPTQACAGDCMSLDHPHLNWEGKERHQAARGQPLI